MGKQDRQEMVADGFMTIEECMQYTRLGRTEIYSRMDRGLLAYARFGRRRMIPKRAVLAMAEAALVVRAGK